MDYYAIAERTIKKERKKSFETYKQTEEYKIRLEEEAAYLKKTYESKRNTRIRLLAESKFLPDMSEVVQATVEDTLNVIKTGQLAVERDANSYRKTPLDEIQHFDALDFLDRSDLTDTLHIRINNSYCYALVSEYAEGLIQEKWLEKYKEINVFKKCDKEFMDSTGVVVAVDVALERRYKSVRVEAELAVIKALKHKMIVGAIFANEKYAYLKDVREYRDALRKMMLEKIPSDYTLFYPLARTMHRHFILHVGPTNSGKTYDAIADLMQAPSGIYLAPLRLLALENQEKMNANGVLCDLYTGEEQIIVEGANHTSSTIETLSLNQQYDVAVIDEAQLISDEQRGWAWTRAILGVRANTVHVCMSADAEKIVKKLITMCGDSYKVIKHERNTPLVVENRAFIFPDHVQTHDAIIVFSRRSVWNVAAELELRGIKASVIYGALPPSVRREEVRKFVDGETSVVVATDAIGMGLNLPIRRVIFLETEKFDGKTRRPLLHSEYKQIAGRAGRRGIFDTGYVAVPSARKSLKKAIEAPYEDIQSVKILFPESLLTIESPLIDILKLWKGMIDADVFQKAEINKEILLCELLDKLNIKLPKKETLGRIQIPFNHEDQTLLSTWTQLVTLDYHGNFDINKYVLPAGNLGDSVQDLEEKYKICDLVFAFARVVGCTLIELERIMDAKNEISDMIIAKLKENKKGKGRRCKSCHKPLPFGYQYGYCQRCYNEMCYQRNWWHDDWY